MQGQRQASVYGEGLVRTHTAVPLAGQLMRLQVYTCIAFIRLLPCPEQGEAAVLMRHAKPKVHTWGTGARPAEQ